MDITNLFTEKKNHQFDSYVRKSHLAHTKTYIPKKETFGIENYENNPVDEFSSKISSSHFF